MISICFGDPIVIDGDFSDWVDKPGLESEEAADIPIISDDEQSPLVSDIDEPSPQPETTEIEQVLDPQETPSANSPEFLTPSPPIDMSPDDNQQNSSNQDNPKYKVSQLKWSMGEDSDVLHIMARLSHPDSLPVSQLTTEIITDYGEFVILTTYNADDGSVMSVIQGQNIESTEGKCQVINKNTIYIEYAIPISSLIENMKWGYQLKFRVLTPDDIEPKKGYIIVSTASTAPYLGVIMSAGICIAIPYIIKRKKSQ